MILNDLYIINNIKFRAESSKIFVNYKMAQSFVLNEIINNPAHEFSKTAKELQLACFESGFMFLIDLEHFITMSNDIENLKLFMLKFEGKYKDQLRKDELDFIKNTVTRNLISSADAKQFIKIMFLVKYRQVTKAIRTEDCFDKTYTEVWEKTHRNLLDLFIHTLLETPFNDIEYFTSVGDILAKIMHHILYEIYEIDLLIAPDTNIILNYDILVNEVKKSAQVNLLAIRFSEYVIFCKQHDCKIDKLYLKIYTDDIDNRIIDEIYDIAADNDIEIIKE